MMRDRVAGWREIERIDVLVLRLGRPSLLAADRWVAPDGTEGTILTFRAVGRGDEMVARVASCATVARAAGSGSGQYVLDPQLRWLDLEGRRYLVSPALRLRISVRSPEHPRVDSGSVRARIRPCKAIVEPLDVGDGRPEAVFGQGIELPEGSFPAVHTRWPIPVTRVSDARIAPVARANRLATGPAAFSPKTNSGTDRAHGPGFCAVPGEQAGAGV